MHASLHRRSSIRTPGPRALVPVALAVACTIAGCAGTSAPSIGYAFAPGQQYTLHRNDTWTVSESSGGDQQSSDRASATEMRITVDSILSPTSAAVHVVLHDSLSEAANALSSIAGSVAVSDSAADETGNDGRADGMDDSDADEKEDEADSTSSAASDTTLARGASVAAMAFLRAEKRYDAVLRSNGRVDTLTGWNRILSALTRSLPPESAQLHELFAALLRMEYGDDVVRDAIDDALHVYPATGSDGSTWTTRTTVRFLVPFLFENTVTLAHRGGDSLVLESRGELLDHEQILGMDGDNPVNFSSLSGNRSGRIVLDSATGWIRSADISVTISGEIENSDPGDEGDDNVQVTLTGRIAVAGSQEK